MPIIKSAKKRMRQTVVRRTRNQMTKRSLRAELKIFAAAIEAKDGNKAATALKKVQANLDKSVKKGLIKKNAAARKMSRLSEQVKKLGAKPATGAKKVAAKPAAKKPVTTAKPATKIAAAKPAAKKAPAKKPAAKK